MKLIQNQRLLSGFIAALTLFFIVAWLNWYHIGRTQAAAELVNHTERVCDELDWLLIEMQDIETGARGFVVTGDPAYLEPFDASLGKINDQVRALRTLTSDNPRQQANCDALEPLILQRVAVAQDIVDLGRDSGFEAAQQKIASGTGKTLMDQVRARIHRMAAEEQTLLEECSAADRREASTVRLLTITGTGLSFVLLVTVFALVLRENRLRHKAQAQRERFFTLSLDMLCIAGMDGYFKRLSPAFHQTLGYTTDELLERPFLDFIHPDDRAATLAEVEKLGAGEPALHFENRYSCKDGSWKWLSWKCQPDPEENLLYATARDVTGLKAAADALRASEENLAVTLQSIGDAVLATDGEGRITRLNAVAEALTGWPFAEAVGRPVEEIFHVINEATRQPAFLPVADTLAKGTVHGLANHTLLIARDGTERPIADSCAPIRNREGRVMGAVLVFRDMTEDQRLSQALRRALDDLTRANAELSQASKLKDEFLANMSHELRTPLNAILGLSEALLEQISGTLTPRQVKAVTTISTSGAHLLALINDILDLSKIEAGKLELHAEPLNLDEFCQSCLVFVKTQAMQKQIYVDHQRDPRPLGISVDPKRLKQILVNLLTNAVKFTPEGGRIGLTVSAPEGEDVVRFTVWDTGIGIEPGDAAKLFHAFTQIDSGLNRAQEGSGLGLALVAKLAKLHGGSVAIESEPGKGSRFIVTLPRHSTSAPTHTPANLSDRRDYHSALIIEDDATAGAQLVRYITELGLHCSRHTRGAEAVDVALRERPDVIFLDIQLPGESGWVVLARLKELPATRNIPVVVVSVVDEPEKSRALGAVAHFTKPVTREQLAEFLQRPLKPKAPSAAPAPARGPRILLAEDNEANIQTIGDYLMDHGYDVLVARNGVEAVERARVERPALILMDVQMPVMDGLEAIRHIRAEPELGGVPIIALTALAMAGDHERCLGAGADDYLSKPVGLRDLAQHIRHNLRIEDPA